ncbi:hypothetical protein [Enterobacter cancerogenus]|uniref:hypothetical protein n=1 Tax=Enterobacter cancerogenus TaxID=69218 RepID=UPI00129954A8|nr:hypothetical protein [Enterobacter cancerogenus]QGG11401.1 hypothetical protein GH771_22750 [Enterobacter cancerogenus]
MLLKYLTRWEEADALAYRQAYNRLGGNASSHPDLLNIQHELFSIPHRYMIKSNSRGDVTGAICVWKDIFLANDSPTWELTKKKALPISKDELILPLDKSESFLIPYRTKILSSIHKDNVKNSTYTLNSSRKICIAKKISEFTSKSRQTRQREVKKFIASGGRIEPISNFNASEAMDIYDKLFHMRRGVYIKDLDLNKTLLRDYPDKFFGMILIHNEKPCAMQVITKAETEKSVCFDYINIGYDTSYNSLCLGTVLTWLNLKAATEFCDRKNKAMRFSFGKPTFPYKKRWCHQEPLGRIITF